MLLVRRANPPEVGRWTVPGGKVRWGETMAQAVERELAEETGLVGHCGRLVGWAERIGPTTHFVIADFEVAASGQPRAGSDAADVAWVPFGELERWPLVSGLLDFLTVHGVVPPTTRASQATGGHR